MMPAKQWYDKNKNDWKPLLRILQVAAFATILFFFGQTIYHNWESFSAYQFRLKVFPLLLAVFIGLIVYVFLGPYAWQRNLMLFDVHLPLKTCIKIKLYAAMGKYLPGKMWAIGGRVYLAKRQQVSSLIVLTTIAIEIVVSAAASLIVFSISFAISAQTSMLASYIPLILVVFTCLLLLHPRILNLGLRFYQFVRKQEVYLASYHYLDMIRILALYIIIWYGFGLALHFLINSFALSEISLFPKLAGSFSLSLTIGVFAVFAPAGLGVRESVLYMLLNPFFVSPLPAMISVAARVWLSVVEFLGLVIVFILPTRENVLGLDN